MRKDPIIGGAVCPEDIRLNFYGGDSNISPCGPCVCVQKKDMVASEKKAVCVQTKGVCVLKRRLCVYWKKGRVC